MLFRPIVKSSSDPAWWLRDGWDHFVVRPRPLRQGGSAAGRPSLACKSTFKGTVASDSLPLFFLKHLDFEPWVFFYKCWFLNSSRKFRSPSLFTQWRVTEMRFCVTGHKIKFCSWLNRSLWTNAFFLFLRIWKIHEKVLVSILISNVGITKLLWWFTIQYWYSICRKF